MRPVFHPHQVVLDGAKKLLTKDVVDVPKGVERKRGRILSVADGRCFGSGDAFRDGRRRSGIGRGNDPCF